MDLKREKRVQKGHECFDMLLTDIFHCPVEELKPMATADYRVCFHFTLFLFEPKSAIVGAVVCYRSGVKLKCRFKTGSYLAVFFTFFNSNPRM